MSKSSDTPAPSASAPRIALLLTAALLLSGCPPTCQQVCGKLDRCGFDDSVLQLECQLSCERELQQYKELEDDASVAAFNDQRVCLGYRSCEEIEQGVCYEKEGVSDLFLFEQD